MIKDRRRQRRTEVEQVLLQHPDIVQAFVVGIPEIVAAPVELRGRVPTDPLARRDLPRSRQLRFSSGRSCRNSNRFADRKRQ